MKRVSEHVSQARLCALLDALGGYGARAEGGVDRQAFSDADLNARRFLTDHARSLGCEPFQDPAGNLFFRRAGAEEALPVVTGSHIDTQPIGGQLDGAYGVCAGLEVIASLNDSGASTCRPIEVVAWANEEGCRFSPGSTGSAAFVDPQRLHEFMELADAEGNLYGDCLAKARQALGDVPVRDLAVPFDSFLELHIEQGPVLENLGKPIGIVEGVQAVRWFRVSARGAASHAGTTPLAYRKDALRSISRLMQALYSLAEEDGQLRLTIGAVQVLPGAINTVPEQATMTVDMRHPESFTLDRCEGMLTEHCAAPVLGCHIALERLMSLEPTRFDPSLKSLLLSATESLGLRQMGLMSGAFHDAVHLVRHCPTGMLFVPSRGGISHNSNEYTSPEELVGGVRVLAEAIGRRAGVHD